MKKTMKSNIKNWKETAEKMYHERLVKKTTTKTVDCNGDVVGVVHVTRCSIDQKLAGFIAINTPVANNPICQARVKKALEDGDVNCICIHCYAERLLAFRKNMQPALMYNQHILTSHVLSESEIAAIPVYDGVAVRFEQFGDICNAIQAENYVRIAGYHKAQTFATWTKNNGLYKEVYNRLGKPENLRHVKSSVHMDVVDDVGDDEWFVDTVFTVCSTPEKLAEMLARYPNSKRCNGVKCNTCKACYNYSRQGNSGKVQYVFELVR